MTDPVTQPSLPAPLTPADCDLRGLEYMPLLGTHLFGSEFNALATDAEYRAAERLWWAAWNQQPAGSLPNNDLALCKFAGKGDDAAAVKRWLKIKPRALHGFVLCSDGRLYHRFLCKQAVIAWEKRMEDRLKHEAEARRKKKERAERAAMFDALKDVNITPDWNISTKDLRDLHAKHVTSPVTRTDAVTGGVNVTAKTGRDVTGRDDDSSDLRSAGADAPPAVDKSTGTPEHPERSPGNLARRWLVQHGVERGDAAAFVNTLAAEFGTAVASQACAEAATKTPVGEAKAFLRRCAERIAAPPSNTVPSAAAEQTQAYLAQREADRAVPPGAKVPATEGATHEA